MQVRVGHWSAASRDRPIVTDVEAVRYPSTPFPQAHKPLNPAPNTGDRVLVAKFLGVHRHRAVQTVRRGRLQVPRGAAARPDADELHQARGIGLGAQTIGIQYRGDLYVAHLDYAKLGDLESYANGLQDNPSTDAQLETKREVQRQLRRTRATAAGPPAAAPRPVRRPASC